MEYGAAERRQTERVELGPAYEVTVETAQGAPVPGIVRDMSEGGVGVDLRMEAPLPEGEEVILQIREGSSPALLATARVVWAKQRSDGLYAMGFQWTQLGPKRQRLQAMMESARV